MNNTSLSTTAASPNPSTRCNYNLLIDTSDSHRFSLNVAIIAINSPFAIFAVLANLLVIITVKKTKELHVPANALLCGLASTDLLVGLVVQPLFITWRLLLHYGATVCNPADLVHSVYEGFLFLCVGGSFVALAHLSTDRFMAVTKPLKYRAHNSMRVSALIMGCLMLVWSIFVLVRIFGLSEDAGAKVIGAIASILAIYLLFIQVALLVGIKRSNRHIHSMNEGDHNTIAVYERERRAAVTIGLIFVALLVFLVPVVIVQVVTGYTSENADKIEMHLALSAILINSSANPVIYFLRNIELRKSALRLLNISKKNPGNPSSGESTKSNVKNSQEETA